MAQDPKAIARRINEDVWSKGKVEVIDELFAPDLTDHMPPGYEEFAGREGMKNLVRMFDAAFPDMQATTEDVIVERDKVVNRWSWRGTHQGDFMGTPATGKQATMTGIEIFRLADGKIVERWVEADMLGFMQQLGAIPSPEEMGQR